MRRGSTGEDVRQLQVDLRAAGFDPVQIDGIFGPNTDAAVRAFQGSRGLDVDGIVGPLTRAALAEAQPAPPAPPPTPPPPPPPTPTTFVRRDVWSLESAADPFDPITLAYARAVQVMQARPVSDRTSWAYQGAIHGSSAPQPSGAHWNECQHFSWFFLPWHRMYLFFFERIVRAAVVSVGGPADFAIPYWNYDQASPRNTLPPAFRTPTLPDGTPNPLFLAAPLRRASINNGAELDPRATSPAAALNMTNFTAPDSGFGSGRGGPAHFLNPPLIGGLESTPHNVMHGQIGGPFVANCGAALMSNPDCAALDPIFWLHHANIDRLWNRWLALGGGRANPTDASWLSQRYVFADETGAEVTRSVADVLDSAGQLSYSYDDLPSFTIPVVAAAEPPSEQPPAGAPELVAATDTVVELAGASQSVVPLTVPASTVGLFDALPERSGRVLVNVENIEVERDPGIAYAVYLNLPAGADTASAERHYIGNISFFGIQKMSDPDQPHGDAAGFRHGFDVTDVVSTLKDLNLWDPSSLTVTFEPIAPLPPPGDVSAEEPSEELPPVRIGRVSLFMG